MFIEVLKGIALERSGVFLPEDGGGKEHQNVGTRAPNYMLLHLRSQ
jgi:hypothetical protein